MNPHLMCNWESCKIKYVFGSVYFDKEKVIF